MNIKTIGLLVFLLIPIMVFGQSEKPEDIQKRYWTTEEFTQPKFPEHWKNESAIILSSQEYFKYDNFRSDKNVTMATRAQVLLNDKAAVKKYTVFEVKDSWFTRVDKRIFGQGRQYFFMGIRIIKPDGRIIHIDVQKEIKETREAEKIAVPNLEPGDVIDYYMHYILPFDGIYQAFPVIEKLMAGEFPILDYKLKMRINKEYYVNFKSFNGAPELEEILDEDSQYRAFELKAANIEKSKPKSFYYPKREEPHYKMQAYYSNHFSGNKDWAQFLSEESKEIKRDVTTEDISRVVGVLMDQMSSIMNNELHRLKYYQKDNPLDNKVDFIKQAYNYLRFIQSTRALERLNYNLNDVLDDVKYSLPIAPAYQSRSFGNFLLAGFVSYLESEKVDFELLVGMDKSLGDIKDLLFTDELLLAVRVHINGEALVFSFPEVLIRYNMYKDKNGQSTYVINEVFKTIPQVELENTNGYALKKEKTTLTRLKTSFKEINLITFPSKKASSHKENHNTKITLKTDTYKVNVTDHVVATGYFKTNIQNNYLNYFNYIDDLCNEYGVREYKDRVKISSKNAIRLNDRIQGFKESIANLHERKLENLYKEKVIFTPVQYKFQFIDRALTNTEKPIQYSQSYTVEQDGLKKAGKNLLLDLGQIIESPFKFEETEDYTVYFDHLFTRSNQIEIEIPDGYTVKNVETFNKTLDNTIGSFKVEAREESGKLVFKTTFVINVYKVDKTDWEDFTTLTEAIKTFYEKKLLLISKP